MGTIANACIIEKRNIAGIHKGHLKRDAHTHTHTQTDTQRRPDCDMVRETGNRGWGMATHADKAQGT